MHSHELFQNSVHRSLLIFIYLCPPSEDETSELCLGLQTLLELKVSFVCDSLISDPFYRSPVLAANSICKDASQDWGVRETEKKKKKSTFHEAQVDILNVESGKRLNRFILVAQYVSDSYCEGKSKIIMKRGYCGRREFDFHSWKFNLNPTKMLSLSPFSLFQNVAPVTLEFDFDKENKV